MRQTHWDKIFPFLHKAGEEILTKNQDMNTCKRKNYEHHVIQANINNSLFFPSGTKRYFVRKLSATSIHHQAAKSGKKGDLRPV